VPVDVPASEEYVALGAARQAAWVLAPEGGPPAWSSGSEGWARCEPRADGSPVRARYAEARELTLDRPPDPDVS